MLMDSTVFRTSFLLSPRCPPLSLPYPSSIPQAEPIIAPFFLIASNRVSAIDDNGFVFFGQIVWRQASGLCKPDIRFFRY